MNLASQVPYPLTTHSSTDHCTAVLRSLESLPEACIRVLKHVSLAADYFSRRYGRLIRPLGLEELIDDRRHS